MVNQPSQTLRQCWPNPFSAEMEGCGVQYHQGALYNICRWVAMAVVTMVVAMAVVTVVVAMAVVTMVVAMANIQTPEVDIGQNCHQGLKKIH